MKSHLETTCFQTRWKRKIYPFHLKQLCKNNRLYIYIYMKDSEDIKIWVKRHSKPWGWKQMEPASQVPFYLHWESFWAVEQTRVSPKLGDRGRNPEKQGLLGLQVARCRGETATQWTLHTPEDFPEPSAQLTLKWMRASERTTWKDEKKLRFLELTEESRELTTIIILMLT